MSNIEQNSANEVAIERPASRKTDRKNFLIALLGVSAAVLTLAHLQLNTPARAAEAVMEDDYQLVTARTNQGNDGLYVLDKRNNRVVLFTWDAAKKSITPKDVKSLDVLLGGS